MQEEGRLIFKNSYNYNKGKKSKYSVETRRVHGGVFS